MVLLNSSSLRRSIRTLAQPLRERSRHSACLSEGVAGQFRDGGDVYEIPRFVFSGPQHQAMPLRRIGIFGGLHGDEPASCEAGIRFFLELSQNPERAKGYELWLYPVCNPTGYEDHTRHSRAGLDLNREFWRESTQPEVRILQHELKHRQFDGIMALHADDTCEGLYGYAQGRFFNENLLRPALMAAKRHLACDLRSVIDGFPARESVIDACYQGILAPPPEQEPRPFEIIFETPALAPVDLQIAAACTALQAVLDEYRRFLAYGADL